jgi:hypothetical protein
MPSLDRQLLLFITIISSFLSLLEVDQPATCEARGDRHEISGVCASDLMSLERFEEVLTKDTSLFKAFQNLRFADYTFTNTLIFHKDDHQAPGVYNSINHQRYRDSCRSMSVEQELRNQNFFLRGGKHRFKTAKLYDSLFYTHHVVCHEEQDKPMIPYQENKSRLDHYTDQLKVLVFRPGTRTDLPFLGPKTAIFTDDLRPYYEFHLKEEVFKNRPVYVFKARPKSHLTTRQKNKLAIQNLETYLDRETHQVLFRKYHVKMNNWIFDCDVKMQIDIQEHMGKYYPKKIQYDGHWDVIGIEEEKGKFEISFYDFK